MPTVAINKKIPKHAFTSTKGDSDLASFKGKKLVLYFYPKDSTSGCTKEAEDFRDAHNKFKRAGAVIVGVSRDSLKSHQKFIDNIDIPFELISDPDETLCNLFDVMKEKSMYGRKYMGIERSTFLIDETGTLKQEWRKLKVPGHVDEVLAAVKAL